MNNKNNPRYCFNIKLKISLLLSITLLSFSNIIHSTVLDAAISTGKAESRIIDLSNNITNISQPNLSVATQPTNGIAQSITCPRTGENLCITYTPNINFSGVDSFQFSTINDDGETETGTISVNVANTEIATSGIVPNVAIQGALNKICGSLQANEVDVLCQGFNTVNATAGVLPEDLRELINAITPQDIAAQGTTSNVLAAQQLENISKHLSALRRGQKNITVNGFSFRTNNRNIPFSSLFNANDGAAQKVFGINWGWFINGSLGGGKQDETIFENGFDFTTDGLSMGADYRLGNNGIVGLALGYGNTKLDISQNQGDLDAKGFSTVLYASIFASRKVFLDVIASTNQYEFDATRRIVFGSTDTFSSSLNKSKSTALNVSAGYEFLHYSGFVAIINSSAEFMKSNIDGYAETGDSPFNVTVDGRTIKTYTATVGTTLTYAMSFSKAVVLPQLDITAVKQVERGSETIQGFFSSDPNSTRFRFNSNIPDENFLKFRFGVSSVFTGGHSAFIQLGTTLRQSNYQNWNTSIGYRTEL